MESNQEKHFIKKKDILIKSLNLIEKYHQLTEQFYSALEELGDNQGYCNTPIYNEYEEAVIDLLHCVFQIPMNDDILEWYIYDTNFGKDIVPEIKTLDKNYTLDNMNKLYDYLIDTYWS